MKTTGLPSSCKKGKDLCYITIHSIQLCKYNLQAWAISTGYMITDKLDFVVTDMLCSEQPSSSWVYWDRLVRWERTGLDSIRDHTRGRCWHGCRGISCLAGRWLDILLVAGLKAGCCVVLEKGFEGIQAGLEVRHDLQCPLDPASTEQMSRAKVLQPRQLMMGVVDGYPLVDACEWDQSCLYESFDQSRHSPAGSAQQGQPLQCNCASGR